MGSRQAAAEHMAQSTPRIPCLQLCILASLVLGPSGLYKPKRQTLRRAVKLRLYHILNSHIRQVDHKPLEASFSPQRPRSSTAPCPAYARRGLFPVGHCLQVDVGSPKGRAPTGKAASGFSGPGAALFALWDGDSGSLDEAQGVWEFWISCLRPGASN